MNEHKERAAFTISKSLKAELEDTVPLSKRSQFVERAIADALLKDARQKALDALNELPSYDTHGVDSVALLRQIRHDRSEIIIDRHKAATK
jgi:hypothetical protein